MLLLLLLLLSRKLLVLLFATSKRIEFRLLWNLILHNNWWFLFIIVYILPICLRVLIFGDTWLVKLHILNLIVLYMKNFRLCIILIVRLLCYELKVTRRSTGIVNIFQDDQLFLDEMFLQVCRLLLLATATFEHLLEILLGLDPCQRVVSFILGCTSSRQAFRALVRIQIPIASILALIHGRTLIEVLCFSWSGCVVLNLLFLFLQSHYLPPR